MANNEFNKEAIIKWIAQRIKDEQRKHEKHQDRWHEIAARKIYASYCIELKHDNKSKVTGVDSDYNY
jgi:hypothetical protein